MKNKQKQNRMKKAIMPVLAGILLISLVSAIALEAGDSYTIELGEDYSYYELSDSSCDGYITVTPVENGALIEIDKYIQDCSVTITFYSEENEVVGGGGGSSGRSGTNSARGHIEISTTNNNNGCSENWQCDEWRECSDGKQTRTCEDLSECGTSFDKPEELRECLEETIETETSTNFLTGAVAGVAGLVKPRMEMFLGLIICMIGGIIFFIIRGRI